MADPNPLMPHIQPANGNNGGGANQQLANIIQALDIIHSRTSTNEIRKHASEFLEQQKSEKSAIQNGYFLASDRTHAALVRHFGLSLLENVLKYNSGLSPGQLGQLRGLVLNLAEGVQSQDPSYIRNKVSLLWVELAKRTWGPDWVGMDGSLMQLWGGRPAHKELVLTVLETLSEDIIHQEDTASSLRGVDLNRALVEICVPIAVFQELYPQRDNNSQVGLRCGNEGWLYRISALLNNCVQGPATSPDINICALKSLAALRSMASWAIPLAISSSQCIPAIFRALTVEDEGILLVNSSHPPVASLLLIS